jgi:hypothetical protein
MPPTSYRPDSVSPSARLFATTRWSAVLAAGKPGSPRAIEVEEELRDLMDALRG